MLIFLGKCVSFEMAEDGTAAAEIIQRLGLNMYFYDPNVCPIYRQYCVDLIFAPCLALSCLCKTAQIMRAKWRTRWRKQIRTTMTARKSVKSKWKNNKAC